MITHIHLGHGPSTYHQTTRPPMPISTWYAGGCGQIGDVPDTIFGKLSATVAKNYGFAIDPATSRCKASTPTAKPAIPGPRRLRAAPGSAGVRPGREPTQELVGPENFCYR